MHAVLLAAGVGRRLIDITGGGPKCLLPFGGASLLERHLRALAACGIHRLTVVVGCEAMQIEQALAALVPDCAPQMTVDTIQNPDFRLGSAISVWTARDVFTAGDDVLLMDADVLYDRRMLARLLDSARENVFLMDRNVDPDDAEPVKLCARNDRLVGFDKQLPADLEYDVIGESVGFFRLTSYMGQALTSACQRLSQADADTPYEHALRDVLLADPDAFGYEDITGLPWIEIDYPEDVERAVDAVLPELQAVA
ncbi:phosphocholine cytidylyltransferase family protein [Salinisphaera aquimarina]|uniref:NTP transferase domain-containing protein n=1 Tax=Salinisphaera aquimarina TaxID=2094031 RepID=A0ABV7EVN6_9GAMM